MASGGSAAANCLRAIEDNPARAISAIAKISKASGKLKGVVSIAKNVAKATGYGILAEVAFATPFAINDIRSGESVSRTIGNATYGLVGQTVNEEEREFMGEKGYRANELVKANEALDQLGLDSEEFQGPDDSMLITDRIDQQGADLDKKIEPYIMEDGTFNEEQFLIIQKTLLAAEASYTIISRDIGTTNGWASNEWGLSYPVDQSLSETLAIDYDALVVPGGSHQIDTLSNDLHARRILRAFLRENEPVALAGVSTMLLTTIDAAKDRKVAASDADSALLIAAGAEIIDEPTVRDKNLISATSGEAGISVLLDMLAQAIQETKSN